MDVFDILSRIFYGIMGVMQRVPVFGVTMWDFTLGMAVFSFAVLAIRQFFGIGGSDKK